MTPLKPSFPKRLHGFRKWEHEQPRASQPNHVGSTIYQLLDQLGIGARVHEQRALIIWNEVVGSAIASQTEPRSIKNGILIVRVKDPTWRNELTYLKSEILSKLNRHIGSSVVSDIKFS